MKQYSHSSVELFNLCGRRFQLQRIEKWQSPRLPSALFFGSALDEAFGHLLCTKKEILTDEELTLQLTKTAEEVFLENMLIVNGVDKKPVEMPQSLLADYFVSDFTPELLTDDAIVSLQQLEPHYKLVDFVDFHQQCREQLKGKHKVYDGDLQLYNYMTWLTLVEKGKLMINAYRNEVMPLIHRVESIQERISIKNDDGDEIRGLIDFRASFVDSPSQIYTMDNKSSSKPYPENATKESLQLATYCEAVGDTHAGFAVVEKKVFKRGPQIRVTVQKDVIPEETMQKAFDRFEKTVYNVQAGYFPENRDSCYAFGKRCEYYRVCHGGDYSGLVNLNKEVL